MPAEEYDAFINNPTNYMLRTHLPRVLGAVEPFKMLPYLPGNYYLMLNSSLPISFAIPPVIQALEVLAKAGQETAL